MSGRPSETRHDSKAAILALIILGSAGFVLIAADLHFHGRLHQADRPVQYFFHQHSNPTLTLLFSAISGMGELLTILTVALMVAIVLIIKKKWWSLVVWAVALYGSAILNPALKSLFQISRPTELTFWIFKSDAGYSFPSGHTMAVSITAGALALVIVHHIPMSRAKRWRAAAIVAIISLLEAFALLYIGVHYLTDVLAALAVAAAWLGVIRWLLPPRKTEPVA